MVVLLVAALMGVQRQILRMQRNTIVCGLSNGTNHVYALKRANQTNSNTNLKIEQQKNGEETMANILKC